MRESFSVSAPGKLMLVGEHAVLHGRRCLVCAVDQRVRISVRPRTDSKIIIDSALGEYHTDLRNLSIGDTFRFVLGVVAQHKEMLESGFDLHIKSDFDATLGLGSSSAVTAAMTAAVFALAGKELEPIKIFDHALITIRTVQGSGSGADLAAAVFGGLLLYRFMPNEIVPLEKTYPITVVYSGSKMKTTKVIRMVEARRQMLPEIFEPIFDAMDQCAATAANAVKADDWSTVGHVLNINQGLMHAIGVSNERLMKIVYTMQNDPGIFGAKISGAGLGDCVVGLGEASKDFRLHRVPLAMSPEGVRID